MRPLLDANLSPRVAKLLRADGVDAAHVRERAMQRAGDRQIAKFARLTVASWSRKTPTWRRCLPTPAPTGFLCTPFYSAD